MMPVLALRSATMYFLAWTANIWPGPGSSEDVRWIAAYASVKIVTLSGSCGSLFFLIYSLIACDLSRSRRCTHTGSHLLSSPDLGKSVGGSLWLPPSFVVY
jgi:hypothetical protein